MVSVHVFAANTHVFRTYVTYVVLYVAGGKLGQGDRRSRDTALQVRVVEHVYTMCVLPVVFVGGWCPVGAAWHGRDGDSACQTSRYIIWIDGLTDGVFMHTTGRYRVMRLTCHGMSHGPRTASRE